MLNHNVTFPGNGQRWGNKALINLEEMILESQVIPQGSGNKGGARKVKYRDILSAFDIETTSIPEIQQSVMYLWQWAFYSLSSGEWLTIYGRTWDEWQECAALIRQTLRTGEMIVVLDHNLAYEFQFLSGIVDFEKEDVFCTDARTVAKCYLWNALEFRCTLLHSNTSLSVYLKQWHAQHQKLSGDEYDYSKARYPWTELTADELRYGLHDVIGLIEAYTAEMAYWKDTLYTVPMTSTGYVRRICKREWAKVNFDDRRSWQTGLELTDLLHEAFRGGDTHANRYYTTPEFASEACVIHGVKSWDRSSSYPDVLINCRYPLGNWYRMQTGKEWITAADIEKYRDKYDKAVLTRAHFRGLRLKSQIWGMPYIPKSKCLYYDNPAEDNGRILSADYLSITITDIDWYIIDKEYSFDKVYFSDTYYCRYRYLPDAFRDVVRGFYADKTRLKGSPEGSLEEIEYNLKKQLLNALYGMAAQWPIKETIYYLNSTHEYIDEISLELRELTERNGEMPEQARRDYTAKRRAEILARHNRKAFLPYSVGVWCTAWARLELHRSMWEVQKQGGKTIYVDTDSNKHIGDIDFTELNEFYRKRSEANGAYADNAKGKRYYMGVYGYEYTADFATMGAKKYAYIREGETDIHVTIAGVNKQKGAKELQAAGGFRAFRDGMVFREAGGVQGVYNDDPFGDYEVDGHVLRITPNVCLLPDTYTLGLSDEYARLLDSIAVRGTIDGHTAEVDNE